MEKHTFRIISTYFLLLLVKMIHAEEEIVSKG